MGRRSRPITGNSATTRRDLLFTGTGGSLTLLASRLPRIAKITGSIQPSRLSAEHLVDPEGLDTRHPRLSWQCIPASHARHGARQTAYQVIVAVSVAALAARKSLLWDTGKVISADNLLLPYHGVPLLAGQVCHWEVTVWDEHDQPARSASARWSIGLAPEDWVARWIGAPPTQPTPLQADWIGYDFSGPYGPGHGDTTPGYTQYFRRRFELPDGVAPGAGEMHLAVDGMASVFVNGHFAGSVQGTEGAATLLALPALLRGPCVLAAQIGHPADVERTPALIAQTVLHRLDGGETILATDTGWRVSDWAPEGWRSPSFDDTGWLPARLLAASPSRPAVVAAAAPVSAPAVMLRREFTLDRPLGRAWLQASGLGWSEILINGSRLGDAVLSPPLADYDRHIPSVMHEATMLLQPGANVLAALLGRGRFAAPRPDARTFGTPRLRLQLMLDYADGTHGMIVSDAGWFVTMEGPLRANNEYDGETYDTRRELAGWAQPGFDAQNWQPAQLIDPLGGQMVGTASPPTRVLQRLEPVAIHEAPPSPDGSRRWIADFGQNHAGVCRLRLPTLAEGSTITLRHAERLRADGSLDVANLRSALATDRVIGRGAAVDVQPRFTTHGFRYAEITGLSEAPQHGTLQSAVIGDDLRTVGYFRCSNEMLNAVVSAASWSIRSNCRSIRTDCPQRDERQGWLGDPAEDCAGEAFLFDNAAFYAKWLGDIADTQRPDGALNDIAPAFLPIYTDDASWPAALPAIAEMLHRHYGDAAPAQRYLPVMVAWLDRLLGHVVDGRLPPDHWGDWGAPSGAEAAQDSAGLIATAYLQRSLALVTALARRTGGLAPPRLAAAAASLKEGFHDRFFDPKSGAYGDGSATASLLPLAFGLVPPEQRSSVAAHLVDQIERVNDAHPCYGLIGCQWVNRVLNRLGRADLALHLAVQPTRPGLGAMIANGATTLWELWDGPAADPAMSSDNHTMLMGDLLTWLFGDVAGIRPDPERPGFASFTIAPTFVAGLDWVTATHDSVRGPITSAWRFTGDMAHLTVDVPPSCIATIVMPAGFTVQKAAGLHHVAPGQFQAVSGHYEIEVSR